MKQKGITTATKLNRVVSLPHQSPRCGFSRFRSTQSITIPQSVLLLLPTPLHQRAASRVQHPNHVTANSLSHQVARKGSTLSGFVQRSRLEREVGRDLHTTQCCQLRYRRHTEAESRSNIADIGRSATKKAI